MELVLDIKLAATIDNLPQFIEPLSDCAKSRGFTEARVSQIELAVEEALVNVFNYAYADAAGDVELICRYDGNDSLEITIADQGMAFDMMAMEDPDISSDIQDRKIGGLGIFMIKNLVDDMVYQRTEGKNMLVLTIRKMEK